ncbi:hypothetical protein [Candidatus Odyssella thessalonicensis]|uniref:hypothetical protein n=1 Tax=Candidatus Odyssella thessalonicensis TaxID=84647 RepID=UPI000225A952|nr:hypothetical protein [Candidatus Odyssella thessalonicensis]
MRILMFGRPGSGKSTCAVNLGERLSLPVYHVDKIFFKSQWQARDRQEFMHLIQTWVDQEHWIIDGNGMGTLESRFGCADIAIYFNLPWFICLWRVFKRLWFARDPRIDDRAPSSPERVRWGLIKYMLFFRKRYRAKIYRLAQAYPQVRFIEVNSDEHIKSLLLNLAQPK